MLMHLNFKKLGATLAGIAIAGCSQIPAIQKLGIGEFILGLGSTIAGFSGQPITVVKAAEVSKDA